MIECRINVFATGLKVKQVVEAAEVGFQLFESKIIDQNVLKLKAGMYKLKQKNTKVERIRVYETKPDLLRHLKESPNRSNVMQLFFILYLIIESGEFSSQLSTVTNSSSQRDVENNAADNLKIGQDLDKTEEPSDNFEVPIDEDFSLFFNS